MSEASRSVSQRVVVHTDPACNLEKQQAQDLRSSPPSDNKTHVRSLGVTVLMLQIGNWIAWPTHDEGSQIIVTVSTSGSAMEVMWMIFCCT